MIRASVLYPNEPGKKFDFDYYIKKHMAMVSKKSKPYGFIRYEVDKAADSSFPFIAVGHLYFKSLEGCQNASAANAEELMADIPNFTDIMPQIQVSEIVK
jgi:uncharacterized protein (TIGR02118 family)